MRQCVQMAAVALLIVVLWSLCRFWSAWPSDSRRPRTDARAGRSNTRRSYAPFRCPLGITFRRLGQRFFQKHVRGETAPLETPAIPRSFAPEGPAAAAPRRPRPLPPRRPRRRFFFRRPAASAAPAVEAGGLFPGTWLRVGNFSSAGGVSQLRRRAVSGSTSARKAEETGASRPASAAVSAERSGSGHLAALKPLPPFSSSPRGESAQTPWNTISLLRHSVPIFLRPHQAPTPPSRPAFVGKVR